ncbi:hypothetical protein JST99_04770 [Candidatus Dependentiae bacterium]|nr:hypothetical protein [Candidatus Dependentiae bacterium]MCC7414622.1 hypothetical protein [Campylobacterota bacterium]
MDVYAETHYPELIVTQKGAADTTVPTAPYNLLNPILRTIGGNKGL